MLEPDGSPNTAHSLNPVPLIVTAEGLELRDRGILADVAPTALRAARHPPAGGDDRPLAARPIDELIHTIGWSMQHSSG